MAVAALAKAETETENGDSWCMMSALAYTETEIEAEAKLWAGAHTEGGAVGATASEPVKANCPVAWFGPDFGCVGSAQANEFKTEGGKGRERVS